MSEPAAPLIGLVFGGVTPPQSDVVELFVHLGCSKEVSSYEVKLHNFDGKYRPSGATPITVGVDGSVSLGRAPNMPLLLTMRVEDVKFDDNPNENYAVISGRCWGERLFRRTVTATYSGLKGEEIVKDLMDYYAGLSHTRAAVELIENTDTTYTAIAPEDSPVWDILKYVAETADKAGVIGFDFRVAPDGKFEFFPKLSKANATVIFDNVDVLSAYRKNITRIRNKVTIKGLADKSVPLNKTDWTRSLNPTVGAWSAYTGAVTIDTTGAPDGGACIKETVAANYGAVCSLTFSAGNEVNAELYPLLDVTLKLENTLGGTGFILLEDSGGRHATKNVSISPDAVYHVFEVGVGSSYANQWENIDASFNWAVITRVQFSLYFPTGVGSGSVWIHGLYFGGRRFSAVAQDLASQASYGLREYFETDEELWSDAECARRAAALLAYLKDPAEYLTLTSTLLDYGTSPILGADKLHIDLPSVHCDFRVEWVEYHVPPGEPTLEITLELGKEPPKLADYIYGLRTFTVNVEKLSRTKIGKRGVPVGTGGGGTASSYFTSNVEVDKTVPVVSLLTGRAYKGTFAFDGANVFVATYTGNLVLTAANHAITPSSDGSDSLGNVSYRWDHLYVKSGIHVAGVDTIDADGRVAMAAMPRDTAGLIIEAQGAGFYPMYVDPNGRYVPAAHTHESLVRGTKKVEVDSTNSVVNFYDGASLNGAVGHDGANFFVVAYDGSIVLYSATGKILPSTDGGEDLGTTSSAKRFGSLHLKNDVWVAGIQTIDTNGRVRLAGFARDTAGKVLEAQGSGFDPLYVDPNGRYSPATHESAHANLYPSGGTNTGQVGNTTTYWNVMATNSMWYKASGTFACERILSDTEVLRLIQSRSQAEEILTHETTKQWRHMPYDLKDQKGKKILCTCGKSAAKPCPEHRVEWEDRYIVNTGVQLEAAAWLVLELSADVRRLETQLSNLQEEVEKMHGERR
jgi:hypothetical protein